MLITGRCHCGNISLSLLWNPDPTVIPARACSCSFCVKHGGVWTSNPGGALKIMVDNETLVSAYTFGTGRASFHVCARCGVAPVVTTRMDDKLYGVVSIHALEWLNRVSIRTEAAAFDNEDVETRVARWKRNWIANVEYCVRGHPGVRNA